MKKEIKIHLIYGFILLLVTGGLFLYLNSQIVTTQQSLESSKDLLNIQIKDLQNVTSTIDQEVKNLTGDLSQKTTEIQSLNKDLLQVKTDNKEQLTKLEDKVRTLKSSNQDFSEVIEEVIPAIVSIKTNVGSGSGFFVRTNGYLVTNYHVIDGATAASVINSKGNIYPVRIVGISKKADIAVLHINETGFDKLIFADSLGVKAGEKVIAVGSPIGLDYTVTQGIISAVNREINGNSYVQIDVPINPGNSGGPLINIDGKVVGVNTLKIPGYEGLGFALSADYVKNIVNEIIKGD
ncbi:trypsin-like peptidase domain-containing protein [Candidatus Woesearchaeota archaeon]|nr:trypsin-like peptidase domain-containing protein [Candidatus Woesearchaeota archaeon]